MNQKPKHNYLVLSVLLILFVLTGCSVRISRDLISESKMEEVLYDYQIAKALGEEIGGNEVYKRTLYMEYVFKKHNITEAKFDSSLIWYTRNTVILTKIYERISNRMRAQNDEINNLIAIRDNRPKTSLPGDTVDLWAWDRIYRLSGSPLTNRMTFTMPSDSNFMAKDSISWKVNYRFIENEPDSASAAIMSMAIQYENDSIINHIQNIYSSGAHSINLKSDTLGNIRDIKGFIYYPAQNDTIRNLLITDVSLFRYHSNDSVSVIANDSIPADSIVVDSASVASIPVENITEQAPAAQENQPAVTPRRAPLETTVSQPSTRTPASKTLPQEAEAIPAKERRPVRRTSTVAQ